MVESRVSPGQWEHPGEIINRLRREKADVEQEVKRLREALQVAADDLGKAANQFASMHESQQHGHYPEVQHNHHIFAEKEARARAALQPKES